MYLKTVTLVEILQTHSMSVNFSNHFRKHELNFKLVTKLNRGDGIRAVVVYKPQ